MNLFVLLKQVPDTETKIRIAGDGNAIEKGDIKWILNPYDEFAIEEAIKTRDKIKDGATVTVVSAGPDRVVDALRTAVAMGADNAIHVKLDEGDTFLVGKALAEVCKKENAALIFAGKQAIDDDQAALFGFVAEFLDVPSVGVVVKLDIAADKKSFKAEREVEGGTKHVIESSIPAVLGVNKGINSPRLASLPGIMKAKKKEIKAYTPADLGLGSETARTKDSAFALPPERKAGIKISGEPAAQVKELVRLLREEAKVI